VHGSGAQGWHVFGGIVVVVALVTAGATAAVLAPRTGARAGVVTGWLLVSGADLLWIRLLPGGRATPAFYVLCILWLCALAVGIPLLIGDLPRQAGPSGPEPIRFAPTGRRGFVRDNGPLSLIDRATVHANSV
jgi:hypothetical protein